MVVFILKFVLFIGFFVGGFLVVNRLVDYSKREIHNDVAGFIYAIVGVIYAVLLAFVAIAVWEQYSAAENKVDEETALVVNLYRDASAFPDNIKKKIQTQTVQYLKDCIVYEFPAMEKFKISDEAKRSYLEIWKTYQNYQPANAYENIWYTLSVNDLNDLSDVRRLRIDSIYEGLHPFMWLVLYVGAFLTIGFSYLFGTKNKTAHLIMVIGLSLAIVLILLIIDGFEHPFHGVVHVTSESFSRAIEQLK